MTAKKKAPKRASKTKPRAAKGGRAKKSSAKRTGAQTIGVGDFVSNANGQLFMVTHLSDTTVAAKDFAGTTRNLPLASVKKAAAPLRPGAKVKRGKTEYVVVEQSYADAVLLSGPDGETEVSPKGLKVIAGVRAGRYAPKPKASETKTQAAPPATQGPHPDEIDHGMVPVIALSGGGPNTKPDIDRIGFARTKAQANKLLARFKFWGDAARTVHNGERVYVGPVGDSKNGFDMAVYALERMGLSSRANPIRTPAGRVLEARGGRKLASKLMRMRKDAIAKGETPPQRIKRPGGGFLTYESASVIMVNGGLRGNKNAIRPRKARETAPRRSAGDGGIAWYIKQQFGG